MIPANELRIGNWVYTQSTKLIKEQSPTTPFRIKVVTKQEEQKWHPIPLDADILEKAGFEKSINEMHIDGVEYILRVDEKSKSYLRDGIWFSSCGTLAGGIVVLCLCRGNYFSNNISELHQLQNLYFALTGQELEIQL